jgi:hypothetical protein
LCGCLAAAVVLAAGGAGCGGGSLPPAYRVTDGYLKALALGNYGDACARLDRQARVSVERRSNQRSSCARVLARCTPHHIRVNRQDPTQLLYATIDLTINGSTAVARVHGTPVADAIRRVGLAKQGGRWRLTSYGQRLIRCRRRAGSPRHKRTHRG